MTQRTSSDLYGGFNDYDHAYDLGNVYNDKEFVQAVARSSYGRRPMTGNRLAVPTTAMSGGVPTMAMASRSGLTTGLRSSIGTRRGEMARPMTAVRAAGYSSAGKSAFMRSAIEGMQANSAERKKDMARQKMVRLEQQTIELMRESMFAYQNRNFKMALEKAKEAGRKEREAFTQRETHNFGAAYADLTFTVLNILACQYLANGMLNEAIRTYQTVVKQPEYATGGRIRVNIGNILFRQKQYSRALKYYRMGLDRVPQFQTRLRCRILNNIGVCMVRLGRHEDALAHFEECMDMSGDYQTALNLVLTAYCLDNNDKMREAFQRLVDIPAMIEDELKYTQESDILAAQALKNDDLRQWERRRKQLAERTILTAAKMIAPRISSSFADGYAWCVETIKQSVYASLAIELEINKAVDQLKHGNLKDATEALTAFNNKDSKVGSAAANNLALINIFKGKSHHEEAVAYATQALSLDRYNACALVNRGNLHYYAGDAKAALKCYQEALQIESSCVQALFNQGLVAKEQRDFEQALATFYKLQSILREEPQVVCQLASIYEALADTAQAVELYSTLDDDMDPSMSAKLGRVHESEADKPAAFIAFLNSYRMYPANIPVIEWLASYYVDAQFPDKAVSYFENAALLEPDNTRWQLLMASCYRRSGNYPKALELYKQVHRRFPTNMDCLKFLVQVCHELRIPEEQEYARKLKKLEDTNRLRVQRETDSSQGKRRSATNSAQSLHASSPNARPESRSVSSRASLRTAQSARHLLEGPDEFQVTKRELGSADFSYKDPVGAPPARPKTGTRRDVRTADEFFDDIDILEDDLLPDGEK